MPLQSLHGASLNDPKLRIVDDRFRWLRFLFLPLVVLERRLWDLFALWLALIGAVFAAMAVGLLAFWAGIVLALAIQLALALERPEWERRSLARRRIPVLALVNDRPDHAIRAGAWVAQGGEAQSFLPLPRREEAAVRGDVLGLFPEARR